MAERIAVTGANGFVGRHLTRLASGRGWEVVGVVRSTAGSEAVVRSGGRPAFVEALDPAGLALAFAGARAVVHLAGIGAERRGATYEVVNVGGMRRVLEATAEAGVPRVVFLSGLGVARYGMARRCTNRYFLSKLAAEVELYRSGREAVVFRPSYIVGTGSGLIPELLREMASGDVERVGDGGCRMQPIAVGDAVDAILASIDRTGSHPAVFDLVGAEPVTYEQLVERVARIGRSLGRRVDYRVREVPFQEADRQAAAGGYRGMLPDELDCLLCDEVSDPRPLETLLGRLLAPLEEALSAAVESAPHPQ